MYLHRYRWCMCKVTVLPAVYKHYPMADAADLAGRGPCATLPLGEQRAVLERVHQDRESAWILGLCSHRMFVGADGVSNFKWIL